MPRFKTRLARCKENTLPALLLLRTLLPFFGGDGLGASEEDIEGPERWLTGLNALLSCKTFSTIEDEYL